MSKPTIVLVHGAWADASSFNPVVTKLLAAGFTVNALPNELRSLRSDAAAVASFLRSISGPVVLVGHSYGGAVISVASANADNVKALVYVDAFVPDAGESPLSLLATAGGPPPPQDLFIPVPFKTPSGGDDVDLFFNPKYFGVVFASAQPPEIAALLAATQRPLSNTAINEGAPAEVGWKTIPSWYVVGDEDRTIPPSVQNMMATRAKSTISHSVNGDHPSMLSDPDTTVAAILEAVKAVGE
jgi:pimeloyl-ACP methyl ester carboxylesterase